MIGEPWRSLKGRLLSDLKGPPINMLFWLVDQLVFRANSEAGPRGP